MATNDFLVFGGGAGANVITQVTYSGLAARTAGFASGVAQSAQLNKVWRQSSIMAAVLAQFISDRTGADVLDDGTIATILANLEASAAAVNGDSTKTFRVASATQSNHAVNLGQFLSAISADGYLKIPVVVAGVVRTLIIQWIGVALTGVTANVAQTITLPITFPNAVLRVYASNVSTNAADTFATNCIENGTSSVRVSWAGTNAGNAGARILAIGW